MKALPSCDYGLFYGGIFNACLKQNCSNNFILQNVTFAKFTYFLRRKISLIVNKREYFFYVKRRSQFYILKKS